MPAPEAEQERQHGRLLTVLFWAGVGLAPIAALLLLFTDGAGALRFSVVLAVLSVVLIGLSITLRQSPDAVRAELEDLVLEEADRLREHLRKDIATAAHATHRAFGEKLQVLYEQLETLRGQLDAAGGRPGGPAGAAAEPARGYAAAAQPYAARAATAGHPAPRNGGAPPGLAGRAAVPDAGHGEPSGAFGAAGPVPAAADPDAGQRYPTGSVGGRARVPGGVLRHTETVRVTRHTVVDTPGDEHGYGDVGAQYAGGYGAAGYGAGGNGRAEHRADYRAGGGPGGGYRAWDDPADDSHRTRGSTAAGPGRPAPPRVYGRAAEAPDGQWGTAAGSAPGPDRQPWSPTAFGDPPAAPAWTPEPAAPAWTPEPAEPPWSSTPAERDWSAGGSGSVWTGGPADRPWSGRGAGGAAEFRMGERRAEFRADGAGAEYRMADRWAAVRHDDPPAGDPIGERRWSPAAPADLGGSAGESWSTGTGWSADQPVLPAGGVRPPSWSTGTAEPSLEWSQASGRGGRSGWGERSGRGEPSGGGEPVPWREPTAEERDVGRW